jgi:hypothetical protein
MIRTGGGGNDARFLVGILIRAASGLLLRIVWYGLTYWPLRAWRAIQKRADTLFRAVRRPYHR